MISEEKYEIIDDLLKTRDCSSPKKEKEFWGKIFETIRFKDEHKSWEDLPIIDVVNVTSYIRKRS